MKNRFTEKDSDAGRLKVGGEGDDRGWDGWMASPMRWTWVWVGSGSWWWTGSPGMLQSMGSQRVGHNWASELNWRKGQKFDMGLGDSDSWLGEWPHGTLQRLFSEIVYFCMVTGTNYLDHQVCPSFLWYIGSTHLLLTAPPHLPIRISM